MRALLLLVLGLLLAAPAHAQQPAGSRGYVRSRTRADYGSGVTARPASIPDPVVAPATSSESTGPGPTRSTTTRPAPTPTPSPTAAPAPSTPSAAAGWAPTLGLVDLRNPTTEAQPSVGLLASGAVVFGVSYLSAMLLAAGEFGRGTDRLRGSVGASQGDRTCQEARGGVLFIPLVGGIISAIMSETCTSGVYASAGGALHLIGQSPMEVEPGLVLLHALSSVAQLTGALLFTLGFVLPDTSYVDGEEGVAVLPWSTQGGGGAQVVGRF